MRMNDKGEAEILFQDQGAGDIFIVEDKMLLSSGTDPVSYTHLSQFASRKSWSFSKYSQVRQVWMQRWDTEDIPQPC